MSRIIKLTLRGSAGEECEQEMGESERTTVAFSLCKLKQTVRLSTSQGDCHFLVFLMNTTQERKKERKKRRRNIHNCRFTMFLMDCLEGSYFHKALLEESKTHKYC